MADAEIIRWMQGNTIYHLTCENIDWLVRDQKTLYGPGKSGTNDKIYNSAAYLDESTHYLYVLLVFNTANRIKRGYSSNGGSSWSNQNDNNYTTSCGSFYNTASNYSNNDYGIYCNHTRFNSASQPSSDYIKIFTNLNEFNSYILNPYVQYEWSSVASITGNGITHTLAKIASASLNDGEAVSGASVSDFEVFNNKSSLSKLIDEAMQDNSLVTIKYTIPSGTYEYIKLVYKKGSIPTSYSDGTAIDITQSSTEQEISGLADGGTYWFVIFTDKSTSEPKKIKTVEAPTPQEIILYDATGSTLYIDERINADSKWDIYSEYSYDYGKIRLRDGYIGQSSRNNVNNRSTTQAKFNISGYKYLCVTGENTDNLGPTDGRCFVVFSQNKPTDYSELYTLPHTENQYSPINTVSTKKVDISNLGFTEGYITIFGAITRYKVYKLWFEKEVT